MTTTILPARQVPASNPAASLGSAGRGGRPRPPCALRQDFAPFEGKFVIIDGTNVIRLDPARPRLTVLLSLLAPVGALARDYIVYFDANTYWTLKAYSDVEAEAYRELVSDFRWHMVETNGGTPADPLLLAEARARSAPVISRDRFSGFRNVHSWLNDPGRLVPVHEVRENLLIGLFRCPLRNDLLGLLKGVRRRLAELSMKEES